jgi:hypothetical protein
VATPFVQIALRHGVSEPTFAAHVTDVIPSHCAAVHTSPVAAAHAVRAPCGAPTIGVHVPSVPFASHAAHCPRHAMLQQ